MEPNETLGEIYFENNEHNIDTIQIEMGGQRMDVIYDNEIFKVLRRCHDMEGIPFHMLKVGVPYLKYHRITICVEFNKLMDPKLSYNVYENTECGPDNLVFKTQGMGGEPIDCVKYIPSVFSLPVYALIVKSDPYDEIDYVKFDGDIKLKLERREEINGYTIYRLCPSIDFYNNKSFPINFSRADEVSIHFKGDFDKTVILYSISGTILRVGAGMAGIDFDDWH